jgi:hypothetical protein
MSDSVYLFQSVSLSPSSQSMPSSSSHSLLTFPSPTAMSQHTIISLIHCIGYTAFLKTLHSHFSELHCHAVTIHFRWMIHLYFWVYKHTWNHEDSQFSPQMVLVVLSVLNTHALVFCVVFVVVSLSSWLFLLLICGLARVLFLSLVAGF